MTTKTQGEIAVVDVTIESATKARRNDKVVWSMKVFIPKLGIEKYPTPFSMDAGWATDLIVGEQHRAKFSRGKLIKEGGEGRYDNQFYWEIAEWNTEEPLSLPESSVASPNGYTDSPYDRRDEVPNPDWPKPPADDIQTRINIGMAFNAAYTYISSLGNEWTMDQLRQLRDQVYHEVIQVPIAPAHYCYEHEEHRSHSAKTGAWGHMVGDQACLEEQQQEPS